MRPRRAPRRYQLRNCVEVCRRAVHAVDSARVSWPATLALLHLPPGLQEVDAFSSLAEVRDLIGGGLRAVAVGWPGHCRLAWDGLGLFR